jgi:signal transduction histidine kinase
MRPPHSGRPRWLRLPRRTARLRLTVLYSSAFLACGAAVLALTDLLFRQSARPATHLSHGSALAGSGISRSKLAAAIEQATKEAIRAGNSQVAFDRQVLLIASAIALGVFAVAAATIGWLLAGRVLRPLRTITATARDISARNLNQRLAVAGPDDEFRQLGDTLDGLFGRLEASFQAQRHFVANASHELRTPLAAEKTVLQVALADPDASPADLRSACQKALEWTDRQESLIGALLTLASTERGIERWEPFDLADLAARAVLQRQQEAQRRDLRVDTALTSAPATGDPALAQSLVANLVSNAIRHNRDGGRVEVATAIVDGLAVLTVSNTGPLVPADDVDQLFRPFHRAGAQRLRQHPGHGLGLAIVSAIVTAHRAAITARPRPEGGLDVTVTFP